MLFFLQEALHFLFAAGPVNYVVSLEIVNDQLRRRTREEVFSGRKEELLNSPQAE